MTEAADAGLFQRMFDDPDAVARHAEGPRRFVPGLAAGGGMELRALAEMHSGWRFVGIDPAPEMLRLAERTLGPLADRVELGHA